MSNQSRHFHHLLDLFKAKAHKPQYFFHLFVLRLNQWESDRNTEGRRHFKSTTCPRWKNSSALLPLPALSKHAQYAKSSIITEDEVGWRGRKKIKKTPQSSIVVFAFSDHRSSSSWHHCHQRTPRLCVLTHRGRQESSCDTRGRKKGNYFGANNCQRTWHRI